MAVIKDFIDLGYPYGHWMHDAVSYSSKNQDMSLSDVASHILYSPGYAPEEWQDTPCPMIVNLDDGIEEDGDDVSFVNQNKQDVIETMEKIRHIPNVVGISIMPDACPAGTVSVGSVVAAKNAIFPSFHSADVCCSMYMTEISHQDDVSLKNILDTAMGVTHFGPVPRKERIKMPDHLVEMIKSNHITAQYMALAERDFMTQGDGNHFLFVGERESSQNPCIVTHHGSRGFGAAVFKKGKEIAESYAKRIAPNGMNKQYAWIPYETWDGRDYWDALNIVKEWTYENHRAIHLNILDHLNLRTECLLWNPHNFVFKDDNDVFYHAKGATPGPYLGYATTLVPMNMGSPILITQGNIGAFGVEGFLPHGAGRLMSRTEFNRRYPSPSLPDGIDVRSFSGVLDASELPQAYKNPDSVIRQINSYGLGDVVDRILPYGSIMAGEFPKPWLSKKKKNDI